MKPPLRSDTKLSQTKTQDREKGLVNREDSMFKDFEAGRALQVFSESRRASIASKLKLGPKSNGEALWSVELESSMI